MLNHFLKLYENTQSILGVHINFRNFVCDTFGTVWLVYVVDRREKRYFLYCCFYDICAFNARVYLYKRLTR